MKRTNKGTRNVTARQRTPKPVTLIEALAMLESAVSYCQAAGLTITAANSDSDALCLYIPNAHYIITDNGTRAAFQIGKSPDDVWKKYFDLGQDLPHIGTARVSAQG